MLLTLFIVISIIHEVVILFYPQIILDMYNKIKVTMEHNKEYGEYVSPDLTIVEYILMVFDFIYTIVPFWLIFTPHALIGFAILGTGIIHGIIRQKHGGYSSDTLVRIDTLICLVLLISYFA